MEQNCFQFNQQYYKHRRISHGCPKIYNINRNIYTTHVTYLIIPSLKKLQRAGYLRYVDIFVICDHNKTSIEQTLIEFNKLQSAMKFTMAKKLNDCINFLDSQTQPSDSCHPY